MPFTPLRIIILSLMVFVGVIGASAMVTPWWSATLARFEDARHRNHLVAAQAANLGINTILHETLAQITPPPSRMRVALLTTGATMTFTITHVVVNPGNQPGPMSVDVPISQWATYLISFLKNKCVFNNSLDPNISPDGLIRLKVLQTSAVIGCPLMNDRGDLLGGVFFTYDEPASVPVNTDREMAALRSAAAQIVKRVPDL